MDDEPWTLFSQRLLDGLRWIRESLEPECVECGGNAVLERCDECALELGVGD